MPIKPENRKRYPANWKEISKDIRFNRAKNRCEVCGVPNHAVGYWNNKGFIPLDRNNDFDYYAGKGIDHVTKEMISYKKAKIISEMANEYYNLGFKCIVIVLTVGHLDHQPENNDYSNLKAMCQKCHNTYDAPHRKQTIKNYKLKGQLKLGI